MNLFKRLCRRLCAAAGDRPAAERLPFSWLRCAALLLGLLGVALAIYFSVRPSPQLRSVFWVPHWLAQWCDRHGDTRNFPAFSMLGLPLMIAIRNRRAQGWTLALVGVLAVMLEVVQLFIPARMASVLDVICSWAGLAVAWALVELVIRRVNGKTGSAAKIAPAVVATPLEPLMNVEERGGG